MFLADFLRNFVVAENKWHYMRTWGWLDLLSSVPMVDALRSARIFHVLRLLRVLRAFKIITIFFHQNRSRNAVAVTGLACFLLVTLGSIAVLAIEGP